MLPVRHLLASLLLLASASASAQEVYALGDPEPQPNVAALATPDDYLVSAHVGFGNFDLKRVTGAAISDVPLAGGLFRPAASHVTYSHPVMVHQRGLGATLAAAQMTQPAFGGAGSHKSIELVALNASFVETGRRVVEIREFLLSPNPLEIELAMATNASAVDCCTVMAWTDMSGDSSIEIERLDVTGARSGDRLRISGDRFSGQLRHPALVYQPHLREFLLVYETRFDIRARTVPMIGYKLGAEVVVARKLRPAPSNSFINSRPQAAYSPTLRAFMVSWLDAPAYGSPGDGRPMIRAATLDEFGQMPHSAFTVTALVCTLSDPLCAILPTPQAPPHVRATPTGFVVAFSAFGAGSSLSDIISSTLSMSHRYSQHIRQRIVPPRTAGFKHSLVLAPTSGLITAAVFVDNGRVMLARY